MTQTRAVDISAVVTFHSEGELARYSLASVARAKAFAEARGIRVETIIIADSPDQATADYLSGERDVDVKLSVACRDPALARNAGVRAARGEWVAFLDGDDMWGENWLIAAHRFANADGRELVLHPEVSIYFGHENFLFMHVDMEDEDFDILSLAMSNYWTTLAFTRRSVCVESPVPPRQPSRLIGLEDWGWHLETISRGILHKVVPGTAHAIRFRKASVGADDRANKMFPAPTGLFQKLLARNSKAASIHPPVLRAGAIIQGQPGSEL